MSLCHELVNFHLIGFVSILGVFFFAVLLWYPFVFQDWFVRTVQHFGRLNVRALIVIYLGFLLAQLAFIFLASYRIGATSDDKNTRRVNSLRHAVLAFPSPNMIILPEHSDDGQYWITVSQERHIAILDAEFTSRQLLHQRRLIRKKACYLDVNSANYQFQWILLSFFVLLHHRVQSLNLLKVLLVPCTR